MALDIDHARMMKVLGAREAFVQGDVACAFGAILGGCDFFAGYPITPATEIAETMAELLPRLGGAVIQMEDEIASLSAVLGASWAGARAMSATSGPGFSLMQEGIGYACMTETPCVLVNVQRSGPSTGQPTEPAQGDMPALHEMNEALAQDARLAGARPGHHANILPKTLGGSFLGRVQEDRFPAASGAGAHADPPPDRAAGTAISNRQTSRHAHHSHLAGSAGAGSIRPSRI